MSIYSSGYGIGASICGLLAADTIPPWLARCLRHGCRTHRSRATRDTLPRPGDSRGPRGERSPGQDRRTRPPVGQGDRPGSGQHQLRREAVHHHRPAQRHAADHHPHMGRVFPHHLRVQLRQPVDSEAAHRDGSLRRAGHRRRHHALLRWHRRFPHVRSTDHEDRRPSPAHHRQLAVHRRPHRLHLLG